MGLFSSNESRAQADLAKDEKALAAARRAARRSNDPAADRALIRLLEADVESDRRAIRLFRGR